MRKKLLIVYAAILLCITCGYAGDTAKRNDITLLFTNDIHGVFNPYHIEKEGWHRLVGGMEALSHYVNKIRSDDPEAVLIDCGDVMTGSLATKLKYKGVKGGFMAEFLNRIPYSLCVPGNHAFDLGRANAEELMKLYRCPVVLSNLIEEKTGKPFALPLHIMEAGGVKVGVTAVMEESFPLEVDPDRIQGLRILPIEKALKRYLPILEKESDIIVVISHAKQNVGRSIARKFPEIDAVLVASEEGRFDMVKGTPVKSTLGHLRTLGYLKLQVRKNNVRVQKEDLIWLWADKDLEPRPDITALKAELNTMIKAGYTRVLGTAVCSMQKDHRIVESSLGDWITDVMRWKTGTEIGFQNSGGIRANIEPGPVTIQDILHVSPFENTLVTFKISGKQLKILLENDIVRGHDRLQVSGMVYSYFPSKRPGARVWRITVGDHLVVDKGRILDPDIVFTAVSNDYLVEQAEAKYFGFKPADIQDTGFLLNETLCEWMEKFEILDYKPGERIIPLKKK
jgi:2',3'-cyclic-nucleotide 2'-phosphodiesterase (5'-nucleotidase family)